MFASDNTFDKQSGLLRSGKRYKRDFDSYSLGQATAPFPLNSEDSDPEDNPPFGNPLVTPQRTPVTPEIPSQSDSQPSPSIPATGQSVPVNPSPSTSCPLPEMLWPTWLMTLSSPYSKARDQRTPNSSGFYVKQYGMRRKV